MNVDQINRLLGEGGVNVEGLFPHLDELARSPYVFVPDIGLDRLPDQPGLIAVRGPRQFGKSTWLEAELKKTVEEFGAGTAYYLNGDEIDDAHHLTESIRRVIAAYRRGASVKRLFIDEITAVPGWEKSLKRLIDAGEMRSILVVTTGSKASDLRRGTERLPGRKGRIDRSAYLFLPVPYGEFRRVCGSALGAETLPAYLISGGSPIACRELASTGRIPEFVVTMVRDWILGEFSTSGRSRASLLKILELIHRYGATPVGYSKLAREADLANNTVASGYTELLADLLCVVPGFAWDAPRKLSLLRKPCKLHFVNLLAAVAWSPAKIRSIADFEALPPQEQGVWWEWLVAQELWRREALSAPDPPLSLDYWRTDAHEIDFVTSAGAAFYEVKKGKTSALDFSWVPAVLPTGASLTVISQSRFRTERIAAMTFEEFLQGS